MHGLESIFVMRDRDNLLDFLTAIQAFAQPHSSETLGDHLMNVYDILDATDCHPTICLAGGLHAIYGSCHFHTVSERKREIVRSRFGESVESLVYLFSILNRPYGLEYPDELRNWQSGQRVVLRANTLEALRVIESANLLEQGVNLKKYPRIAATLDARIESPEGESS